MRKIESSEWIEKGIKHLRNIIKEKKYNLLGIFYIGYTPFKDELGMLREIQVCKKDFVEYRNKWCERIAIHLSTVDGIRYIVNNKPKNISDIIEEIDKNRNKIDRVSICTKIIKKIGPGVYLTKLFNKYYKVESYIKNRKFDINEKYNYNWIIVYDIEKGREESIYSLEEHEAVLEVLMLQEVEI